ncbi:MAG: GlxA family transcriptional regulator [Steroidobacter sp.]
MARSDTSGGRASIAIVGFDGCSAWITAGMIELFAVANVALNHLSPRARAASKVKRFDCHVIGRSSRAIRGSHGVRFEVHPLRRRYDVCIVPPIWAESRDELELRALKLQSHGAMLRLLSRRSNIMASACSGAVLLADAGLLAGRRATTCWWLSEWLQRRFPEIEVLADKLIVIDGDRWSAAAGSAYMHLGLELVNALAGPKVSAATARLLLVERRRGSQSPFIAPDAAPRDVLEASVERAVRYLDEHIGARVTIAQLCKSIAVNERTLTRKFKAALDMTPLAYLQSRRMGRARQLLEDTAAPLDRIVEQCGYEDIASFRKLFVRHVGMTPREYRSRFGEPHSGVSAPK